MNIENDILRYDFQGWPVYKRTWKEILEELGIHIKYIDSHNNLFEGVIDDKSILDKYPKVLEDDGMGYSPDTKYISYVYNDGDSSQIWVDYKESEEIEKETTFSTVLWPDIQEYMDKSWFKEDTYFDPMKNVWLVPKNKLNE